MPDSDPLAVIAADLYAGPAATFVARRTEAVATARAAGERDLAHRVARLRRPTAAAAAVNLLPEADLDAVSALAVRMRAATGAMQMETLKELGAERSRLVTRISAVVDASGSVREEVRATLLAAIADPAAGSAVRSRTLVRSLSYSGFGEVDISEAVAAPKLRLVPDPGVIEEAREGVAAAQRRFDAAQDARDAAEKAFAAARENLRAAQDRLTSLER